MYKNLSDKAAELLFFIINNGGELPYIPAMANKSVLNHQLSFRYILKTLSKSTVVIQMFFPIILKPDVVY